MRVIRVLCVILASVFIVTISSVSAQFSPPSAEWASTRFAPFAADASGLSLASVFPKMAAPDETERLLAQWARSGKPDAEVVDRLMRELDITSPVFNINNG